MWPKSLRTMIDSFGSENAQSYLPKIVPIHGATTDPEIYVNIPGKGMRNVLQFCSGNYLGMAREPKVTEAVKQAVDRYGLTASGSRWGCGTMEVHVELERLFAQYENVDDSALFFLTTMATQAGVPNVIENPMLAEYLSGMGFFGLPEFEEAELFVDFFTHASVKWAARIPNNISTFSYPHCDMDVLEQRLKKSKAKRKIIATDGIFSAHGDLAPLPTIVDLADKYGAMVLVDDAHGTGTIGHEGKGTWAYYGLTDRIELKLCSFAKAFAIGFGASIVGDSNFINYLRATGAPYVFSGSLPPDRIVGMMKALEIIRDEQWRRDKMMANAKYLRDGLKAMGLATLTDDDPLTPIVPVVLGDEFIANSITERLLFEEDIYAACFVFPAVPKKQARVRLTVMSTHEFSHIDKLLSALGRSISAFPLAA